MSKCRATSFYLAPGKLLYFKDHVVAARIDPASADGYDEWFLVPITHRRDVARIRALYPEWNGVVAHVPVKTLKGRTFSNPIDYKTEGWEHRALAAAALEAPQLVSVDVTSERTIEGRRPYRAGDDVGRITYLVTRWNRELLGYAETSTSSAPLGTLGGPQNLVADLFPPDVTGRRLSKGRTRKLTQLVIDGYVAQVASAAILVANGFIDPHTEEGGKILDAFLAAQSVPLPVSVSQVLTLDLKDLVERSRAAGIEVDLVKVLADSVRPAKMLWPEGALLMAGSRAASPEMRTAIRALVTQDPIPEPYAPWAKRILEALDTIETAPVPAGWLGSESALPSDTLIGLGQSAFDKMVDEAERTAGSSEISTDVRAAIRQDVGKNMLKDGRVEWLTFLAELESTTEFEEIGRVARLLLGEQFPHPAENALVEHMLTVDVLNETQKPSRSMKTFAELDREETAMVARIQRTTSLMGRLGGASTLVRASMADPSTSAGEEALRNLAQKDADARKMLESGGVLAVRNYARARLVRGSRRNGSAGVVDAWFDDLDRLREEKPRLCTTRDDLAKFGETRVLSATELSPAQNNQARKVHRAASDQCPTDVRGEPIDVKVITTRAALNSNANEMHNCTWNTYGRYVFRDRTHLILRVECTASPTSDRRLFNVSLRKNGSSWELGEVNTIGNAAEGWPKCTPEEKSFVRRVVKDLLTPRGRVDESEVLKQGDIAVVALPDRPVRRRAIVDATAPAPLPDAPTGLGARIRRLLSPRRSA